MLRILATIWKGPFYIGQLSQPVSVGDVLLKLLETLWRTAIAIVAVVLIAAAGILAWVYVFEPLLFPPAKNMIEATVTYDDGKTPLPPAIGAIPQPKTYRCTEDYPLRVSFWNRGKKSVTSINFSIEAYNAGHSTNVIRNGGSFVQDAVIPAKTGWVSCYAATFDTEGDKRKLQFQAKVYFAAYH